MKKIAITGGKGGTGKSTVAVLYAKELVARGNKVVLVDLDVECPNDHLLTDSKLDNLIAETKAYYPKLNEDLCTKCGMCVKACRNNAIFQPKNKFPVFIYDLCSACQVCMDVCPQGAIGREAKVTGEIFRQDLTGNLVLITGRAKAGIQETSPIVSQSKAKALAIAKQEAFDFVILDTAAGTHCPIVAALLDVDKAIAVTEPTPMGAYDLRLILKLLKKLGVSFEVFLNQADLGQSQLIIPVLKEFGQSKWQREIKYSRDLAQAYAGGNLMKGDFPKIKLL